MTRSNGSLSVTESSSAVSWCMCFHPVSRRSGTTDSSITRWNSETWKPSSRSTKAGVSVSIIWACLCQNCSKQYGALACPSGIRLCLHVAVGEKLSFLPIKHGFSHTDFLGFYQEGLRSMPRNLSTSKKIAWYAKSSWKKLAFSASGKNTILKSLLDDHP